MRKRIRFQNELILHLLTQKHLCELFKLKFVASEIQLHKLRLDTLAFDEKNNSFVIIEYKNRCDPKVLNQAQNYCDLVLNNKEEFLDRLENPKNVDFDETKVMIISPEFSDEQIIEAKCNFELWQVSLYDDNIVEYKQLKTGKTITLEVEEDELRLTEDDLLKNKTDEIHELYYALKGLVEDEFRDVECRILVDEITLKINSKIICNVKFLKKSFNVYFYTNELIDERNKLRDISNISTGGKASYELKIKSKNDLDYFLNLFKQVYNQKKE